MNHFLTVLSLDSNFSYNLANKKRIELGTLNFHEKDVNMKNKDFSPSQI